MTGIPELIDLIRAEIHGGGPVNFARFMELALYHPEHGYYASGRAKIGRGGDYFTNVSVGSTFGYLLAVQFAEMWEKVGRPVEFTIVEQGANDGVFARDVLEFARDRRPEFFQNIRYTIIEPHPRLSELQRKTLSGYTSKISWRPTIDAVAPFVGIHCSNELFDALPVRLLISDGTQWLERCVSPAGDTFDFNDGPIADPLLKTIAKKLPIRPGGFVIEVGSNSACLVRTISEKLKRGYVLTMDYGLTRSERFADHRSSGTLQIRTAHQLLESPFDRVGEADITAHIDWTMLAEAAQESGLEIAGFCDQHHFLTGIISELGGNAFADADAKSRRALQTLIHPEMLGRSFQALIFQRGADSALGGLRYARDSTRLFTE